MVKALDANQTQKIDRPFVQPIYFCHLLLSGLTLYFSDRNFPYNSQKYEDYLSDLSNIGNSIRNLGGYDNPQVTLRFKNQKIRNKSYLIELFDDYPVEKKYIEIYKLLIDTGETFGSDVSTKVFKGEMGQPYDIDEIGFSIDCSSMLFGKNASLPLDVIDLADFASADPDDVGKYRNIIYGSVKKVVCPWTVAGWVSSLVADINAGQTNIEVSDATNAPATPFTMTIDSEETTVTSKSGNNFTVTRGYYNTEHNKGATVYEKISSFEAEVANHPIKSIGDVYARQGGGEWFRVTAGVTKYTNSSGRAKLVFTDKVTFEQKVNITADTDEGTHPHDATMPTGYSIRKCIPTGASGGSNPTWAIDGNDDSYAAVSSVEALTVTFTEDDLGTINKQYVWIRNNAGSTSGTITCGGTSIGTLAATVGWQRFTKTGGAWGSNVVVPGGGGGNSIGEVYKEVEYSPTPPTVDTHAATGVWTTLSGNSVANMTIGDLVACDVEGYQDDGSGTYTGAPSALIERPDHVRKHILIALLGFVAGDIGASFGTVGSIYAARISGGYRLGFILHDVAIETMDLFERLDLQTRSNMFESGGKFELAFGSTDEPVSQKIFDSDNVRGTFKFGKTAMADIRNKIRAHYFRDYSKSGGLGENFQKVAEKLDSTSITKYGTMQEDIEFSAIGDLSTMVNDVLDWILLQKQDIKRTVEFEAFWDAMILENCDYFTVVAPFWSGIKYKGLKTLERPENQIIEMKGLQFGFGAAKGKFLYFVSNDAWSIKFFKIDLGTFTRVGSVALPSGVQIKGRGAIDVENQRGYLASHEILSRILKIDLISMVLLDVLTLTGTSAFNMVPVVIDTTNQFLYIADDDGFSWCNKINLKTFSQVNALDLPAGYRGWLGGMIDNQYAYFGGYKSNNSRVERIRLSDFTDQGYIAFTSMISVANGAIHTGLGYLYLMIHNANPGKIGRVRTSDFIWIDTLTLDSGDLTAGGESFVVDNMNDILYMSLNLFPAKIIKINLSTFTRMGSISIGDETNGIGDLAIDIEGGFLYAIGVGDKGVSVYKIRLSDFTLIDTLLGKLGESYGYASGCMIG